jgi:hypothetical protein
MKIDYFKRHQRDNIFHYYKVVNGDNKQKEGYQEVLNFLNPTPIIMLEQNYMNGHGLTGTWCTYEVGIPITKEEYNLMFSKATSEEFSEEFEIR